MTLENSLGNILIVDDESTIADLLVLNLRSEGYTVDTISETSKLDLRNYPDTHLVIIDGATQQPSGLETIERLRATVGERIGIIYYSQYESESVLINALDAGADDALSKPFSLRELLARVRAVMRRRQALSRRMSSLSDSNVIRIGDLRIDFDRKAVTIAEEFVNLSNTEYSILALLMRNLNTYNSRIEIFRSIWPDGTGANERIVDTNISRLRRKLGPYGEYIANRSGLGYIITNEKK